MVLRLVLALAIAGAHVLGASPASAREGAVAFFYGEGVPMALVSAFDQIVVEPDNVTPEELRKLQGNGLEVFGYLSVGEVTHARSWYREVEKSWIIGTNVGWQSDILDPVQKGCQDYLLRRADALWKSGYRALFLDTLDSYQIPIKDEKGRALRAKAIGEIVRRMAQQHPGVKIMLNRGFEFIPEVAKVISAVAVESLFQGWDAGGQRYVPIAEDERQWLLAKLGEIKKQFKLPVVVIDYAPADQRELARKIARQIADLGFIPWVATPALDRFGVGLYEPLQRRVLVLYDSQEEPILHESQGHLFLAMPLEYLGLVPDYLDIRQGLPQGNLINRYGAVISWFSDDMLSRPPEYQQWLLRQRNDGLKLVILGRPGFQASTAFLRQLGLGVAGGHAVPPVRIESSDSLIGFEAAPVALTRDVLPWRAASPKVTSHLRLADSRGQRFDPIIIAPWGGMALDPYVVKEVYGERHRWLLNPFDFLRQALDLPDFPVPDVTTENGRRILTTHIDGDGFVSRAEFPPNPYAGQVILDEVLQHYRLPTTVSVIEGEIGPKGLYPKLSPALEKIAQQIFRLPHVEIASHTFSHPFYWALAENKAPENAYRDERGEPYAMTIPGYKFNLEREIAGSVAYIDRRLVPPGKRTRVFLWTGDARPSAEAIALTQRLGLVNLNGGETLANQNNPSLTEVSGLGCPYGDVFQVYAPILNENVYTNSWRGPFYGYRRVIETYELTDLPRRIKPIAIYYHFYSGTKVAALKALKEVYDWALAQEKLPLWVSEYAPRVGNSRTLTLARRLDGSWLIRGATALRTVRLPTALGWPDLLRSEGIAGVRDLPQGRYVSLSARDALLQLTDKPPAVPFILSANAPLVRFRRRGSTLALQLRGHQPVELALGGTTGPCRVQGGNSAGSGSSGSANVSRPGAEGAPPLIAFSATDTGDVEIRCP